MTLSKKYIYAEIVKNLLKATYSAARVAFLGVIILIIKFLMLIMIPFVNLSRRTK